MYSVSTACKARLFLTIYVNEDHFEMPHQHHFEILTAFHKAEKTIKKAQPKL